MLAIKVSTKLSYEGRREGEGLDARELVIRGSLAWDSIRGLERGALILSPTRAPSKLSSRS